MKKIVVWTSGRWDYGHIKSVLNELEADDNFDISVSAPVNHHCYKEICSEFNCYKVRCIDNIVDAGFVYNDVLAMLYEINPDVFIVLGDRFETLMAASAALFLNIPIAHLHGGEDTKGAFDNEIRNAITMMAKWHFVSTPSYWNNVFSMRNYNYELEDNMNPKIYVVGSPSVDSIDKSKLKSKEELQEEFRIDFDRPFVICSWHPVTKDLASTKAHVVNLLNALYRYGTQVLFTTQNIDPKNEIIREQIDITASKAVNPWQVCGNIEHTTFLSLMQYASCMIGNSSAAIIEAVEFDLPAINIGDRQEGRVQPENVFNCGYDEESIFDHLRTIVPKFKSIFAQGHVVLANPYKWENSAKEITKILKKELMV